MRKTYMKSRAKSVHMAPKYSQKPMHPTIPFSQVARRTRLLRPAKIPIYRRRRLRRQADTFPSQTLVLLDGRRRRSRR